MQCSEKYFALIRIETHTQKKDKKKKKEKSTRSRLRVFVNSVDDNESGYILYTLDKTNTNTSTKIRIFSLTVLHPRQDQRLLHSDGLLITIFVFVSVSRTAGARFV